MSAPAIPKTFQDVICSKCQQHLTDPHNAVTAHDVATGGMKGHHISCPKPEPKPRVLVQMTAEHEQLLLTTARILKASLDDPGGAYAAEDIAALKEALAPFDPAPGPEQYGDAKP